MKKVLFIFLAVFVLFSVTSINAQQYDGRKVFSMTGEFIEYIPFSFTVPSGNCGQIKTYEYMPSYTFSGPAYWQELTPGNIVPGYSTGIFKFVVNPSVCDPEFVVEGVLFDGDVYGKWYALEQNPEDLGILVKGITTAQNYFGLSVDDYQYSYEIVFPSYGRKYTLDQLAKYASNGNWGGQPSGSTLVGAIISDSKGYLKTIFFNQLYPLRSGKALLGRSNIVINDNQLVVLIYKENY